MAIEELSNLLNSIQQGVAAINNLVSAVNTVTATSTSGASPAVIQLTIISS
jgi:hypothetical protein